MRAPHLDKPVVEPLTDDQLRALLKACRGADLRDKRDEAIPRLMLTTGARAGEVVALQVTDLSLRTDPDTAGIRRGKGKRAAWFPWPRGRLRCQPRPPLPQDAPTGRVAAAVGGDRGKGCTYDARHKTLAMRADRAGVVGFHPHVLRHTAARRWLLDGGLMAVAGWTRPDMFARYTRAQASARAADEARRLDLGSR